MAVKKKDENLFENLTPLQKGAILLSALGKESTALIFKYMKDADIRKMVEIMSTIEKVPVTVVKRVLEEFFSTVSEEKELLFGHLHNVHFLHDMVGKERTKKIWGEEGGGREGATLDALELVDNQSLAHYLIHEHPQTVAVILLHLDPVRKSDVFRKLPERMQADVINRMGHLDSLSQATIHQLNEVLKRDLLDIGPGQKKRLGGTKDVATLLNSLDKEAQKKILENLSQKNPDLTEEIKNQMLTFEDLIFADDRGLQTIISHFQGKTLSLALKTASEDLKKKFFHQMSERAAQILQEDILALGPTRLSQVEAAQQDILEKVKAMIDQGKILLNRGSGNNDPLV